MDNTPLIPETFLSLPLSAVEKVREARMITLKGRARSLAKGAFLNQGVPNLTLVRLFKPSVH